MLYGLLIGIIICGVITVHTNQLKAGLSNTVTLVRSIFKVIGVWATIIGVTTLIGLIVRGA
jgi:hypothetical protein